MGKMEKNIFSSFLIQSLTDICIFYFVKLIVLFMLNFSKLYMKINHLNSWNFLFVFLLVFYQPVFFCLIFSCSMCELNLLNFSVGFFENILSKKCSHNCFLFDLLNFCDLPFIHVVSFSVQMYVVGRK